MPKLLEAEGSRDSINGELQALGDQLIAQYRESSEKARQTALKFIWILIQNYKVIPDPTHNHKHHVLDPHLPVLMNTTNFCISATHTQHFFQTGHKQLEVWLQEDIFVHLASYLNVCVTLANPKEKFLTDSLS